MMATNAYEAQALLELLAWQKEMKRRPGLFAGVSRRLQERINRIIPEKVHAAITAVFKIATKFLLTGSDFLTSKPWTDRTLEEREEEARRQMDRYKYAATAEGALTGAGGILLGLADLPLWLTIKIKMLTHVAALYGKDTSDFRERLYVLYVLSLAFSSRKHRRKVYTIVANWDSYVQNLPEDGDAFDWRTFQQEYRDFLDIAKLLQLIPGIGAAVGAVVNHRLTEALGRTAMNAYRMRWFQEQHNLPAQ
jgi:uncharacterized protein (DUF697 family)